MRILHLGKFAPPAVGGMESFLAALMNRQVLGGHQVGAVRLGAPGLARTPHEGARPHAPSPWCADVPAIWASGPAPFSPGYRAAVRDLVRRMRPHVVHVHLPNLSALWSLPDESVALVVHWHADVPTEALPRAARLAWPAYNLLLRRVLSRAARIVCTSKAGRDASPALRKHRDKCVVVPLGIETSAAEAPQRTRPAADVERDHDAPEQAKRPVTVLALGRFANYKGFDVLTRAAALTPPNVRFVLAGDGPLFDSVRVLADNLRVKGRMAFPGRVSDASRDRLLAECDIFCLPAVNRAEAFGMVALEAMAAAKPVAACSPPGSGVAEVVDHETTGLLVPPFDPRALARALKRLAARPDERTRMGLAGRRRLVERFDLARVALALEEVYRQAGRRTGR